MITVSEAEARIAKIRPSLTRTARAYLPCQQDAEDAVQEAAYVALSKVDRGDYEDRAGIGGFSVWMTKILVHTCLSMRRQQQTRRRNEWVYQEGLEGDLSDPVEAVERRELADELREIIDRANLTELEATALEAKVLGDTSADTALMLGKSPDCLRMALMRARRKIGATIEANNTIL
jgi:RNA polymerase sigma factor, sigma-70 family